MQHKQPGINKTSGFTLIELMIAMLIGLIIIGGVMQMFMTTRNTQRSSEDQMQMVSDARFALDTIAYDLRHAGLWGGTNESQLIVCGQASNSSLTCPPADDPGPATNDCEGGDWYRDLERPVLGFNDNNPFAGTCANGGTYKPGTDVIAIHYADSLPVPTGATPGEEGALAPGVIYVRSNILGGQIFRGPTYPPKSLTTQVSNWEDEERTRNYALKSPVYYISTYTNLDSGGNEDGIPSLHRVDMVSGAEMQDNVLIPGVEDMQLEFGVDTSNPKDFQVDTYMNADNVDLGCGGAGYWNSGRIISVKIWLLMRSMNPDRDAVGGDQTFDVAGTPVTYTDGVRRFLMNRVVRLRNMTRIDQQSAGIC